MDAPLTLPAVSHCAAHLDSPALVLVGHLTSASHRLCAERASLSPLPFFFRRGNRRLTRPALTRPWTNKRQRQHPTTTPSPLRPPTRRTAVTIARFNRDTSSRGPNAAHAVYARSASKSSPCSPHAGLAARQSSVPFACCNTSNRTTSAPSFYDPSPSGASSQPLAASRGRWPCLDTPQHPPRLHGSAA